MSDAVQFTLRAVRPDDCDMLWRWANDLASRASALSSDPIPHIAHKVWFASKLASSDTLMYIAEDDEGRALGQIRFDLGDDGAEIDVAVDPAHRGHGVGAAIIRAGVEALFAQTEVSMARARVKSWNVASIRAFRRAGFDAVVGQEPDLVTLVARPVRAATT